MLGHRLSRTLPCLTRCLKTSGTTPAVLTTTTLHCQWKRCYTSAWSERANCKAVHNYIQVERDPVVKDVAWVRFNRKPVNSLNADVLMELTLTLENLENNESYRGAILTSANPGIFSAGLDIADFYPRSPEYIRGFWAQIQNMWLRLYGSPLVVMAAINGHSPAGGCLVALACDYRIMAEGKYSIGLNEVMLGIVPPSWLIEMMRNTVGHRHAEAALQLGTLYNPETALATGIIDKVVPMESIEETAREEIQKWLKIPDLARGLSKQMLRKATLEGLIRNKENELNLISSFLGSASTQKSLGRYMESLKKK